MTKNETNILFDERIIEQKDRELLCNYIEANLPEQAQKIRQAAEHARQIKESQVVEIATPEIVKGYSHVEFALLGMLIKYAQIYKVSVSAIYY